MKKMLSYAASLLIIASVAAAPGSTLIEKFNQTFPNAENVKWNDDKAGYFVSFYQNGNFEKVLYNKTGDFVCSWKYTDGKELPVNVLLAVGKKYNDAKILGVTELTTQDNIVYEVKLSKDNKLYSVSMLANGSITKDQKYLSQDENNDAADK